ncbi:M15 family metallopeptidase [Frateuria aurantia]
MAGVLSQTAVLQASGVFQVTPVRPVAELLPEALAARPPDEARPVRAPELVELAPLDPAFKLDIRYAGTRNFLGTPLYSQPRAFLQRPAAMALRRVLQSLKAQGYGLVIFDGYRPWYITRLFWDATPPGLHRYVADPAEGSRHNRGCAVDLSLYELATGRPVTMPSGYDEMTERAHADYPGGRESERRYRSLLRRAMEAEGFVAFPWEWWHFDYRDWADYGLANIRFEDIPVVPSAGS